MFAYSSLLVRGLSGAAAALAMMLLLFGNGNGVYLQQGARLSESVWCKMQVGSGKNPAKDRGKVPRSPVRYGCRDKRLGIPTPIVPQWKMPPEIV